MIVEQAVVYGESNGIEIGCNINVILTNIIKSADTAELTITNKLKQSINVTLSDTQFNLVALKRAQTLEQFSMELNDVLQKSQVDNLILDLRHNSGGNGSILPPLLRTLIYFEALKPNGKLFVIVGRNTYSAAHLLLADISRLTNAIIVGEPSGSRPNHIGEAGWFKLPYSGIYGLISSQYHQASKAEDHRIWIAPHIPVALKSTDYFLGKDPAMINILKVIDSSNPNTEQASSRKN